MAKQPHERISARLRRALGGPVILQQSFRPFFLLAGVWASLAMALWLGTLAGLPVLPDAVDALGWHQHEMLFGFAAAAIAGFILTAIPNWTGGLPVSGLPLAILVALWAAGRIAMLMPDVLGPWWVAGLDLIFLFALAATIGRELASGKNWRNLPVAGLITLLATGNLLVHLQSLEIATTAGAGYRLAVFVLAMLIALIGGRVVPSFTRNWLKKQDAQALPAAMDRVDHAALAALALVAVAEVVAPNSPITAAMALATGALHAWRLARWQGFKVLSEPLLWVLHLGYAWLVAGLLLVGLAGLGDVLGDVLPQSAALHALTTGAFGTMILAVATRASLGHSGRPLTAGAGTTAAYLLVTVAAGARLVSPLAGDLALAALWLAGGAWVLAFGLFTVLYFPVLTRPPRASH